MNITHKNHLLVISRELKRLQTTARILSDSLNDLEARVQSMREHKPKEFNICGLRISKSRRSRDTYYKESFDSIPTSISNNPHEMTDNPYCMMNTDTTL